MREAPDPLETELSTLRPHEVSSGFRRRITERLAASSLDPTSGATVGVRGRVGLFWQLALAGGLAAACLAAVLLQWGDLARVQSKPMVARPKSAPSVELDDAEPRLLAYQRALARSPEELDALLNKCAIVPPEPNPELVRICAFTRSDAALHALLGED